MQRDAMIVDDEVAAGDARQSAHQPERKTEAEGAVVLPAARIEGWIEQLRLADAVETAWAGDHQQA